MTDRQRLDVIARLRRIEAEIKPLPAVKRRKVENLTREIRLILKKRNYGKTTYNRKDNITEGANPAVAGKRKGNQSDDCVKGVRVLPSGSADMGLAR